MTTIIFDTDPITFRISLIVNGHANYDERGKDLVCASVSILTLTIANIIADAKERGVVAENTAIQVNDGDVYINCHCLDTGSYIGILGTFETVLTGYKLIAEEYPKNVVVKT